MTMNRKIALSNIGMGLAALSALPLASCAGPSFSVGQVGNNSIAFFPLYVASSLKLFEQSNVEPRLTNFQSGAVVGAAMTSGSLTVGCSLMTDVFALLKAGRSAKIVGALVNGYYVDVIGSKSFLAEAKVSRSSPLEARIHALRGKRIGITGPGSGTEALVVYLARSAGMDPMRDMELVNVGTDQPSIVAALRTGRLDAVSFAWPLTMVVENLGVGEALISPAAGDVPAMRGQLHGVMYASGDAIDKHGDDIARFVRAIGQAQEMIHSDRERATALLKSYDPQLNDTIIEKLLAAYLPVLPATPRIDELAYEKSLAFHRTSGYAASKGNAFADVVDSSLIQKALQA